MIVQFDPALTDVPQLFVWAKLALATMLALLSEALPLLVRVTCWAALVMFTS